MPLPDPADHHESCPALESGRPPSLVVEMRPGIDASSCEMLVWEQCQECHRTTAFDRKRVPWRRFHRQWRAELAVWFATWEHRHNLGGRVTRDS